MVSVIIVNYNTYQLTVNCIASVMAQTHGVDYEIILVDNQSTECDPQLFALQFPTITLIKNVTNEGFARGNNKGIAVAKGDYILLLNSDTELLNDAVSIAANILEKDASIGVLSGKLLFPNGEVQAAAGRFPKLSAELFELLRGRQLFSKKYVQSFYHGDLWNYELAIETDWVWGTFFMIPKAVLAQFPNGRLHEDYFMYYEDVLWCYYVKKLGYKVVYSPEPMVVHHLSASSKGTAETEKYRNKILPNEAHFLHNHKGRLYAASYYFIKAVHQFTLRKKKNRREAVFYLTFAFKNLFK